METFYQLFHYGVLYLELSCQLMLIHLDPGDELLIRFFILHLLARVAVALETDYQVLWKDLLNILQRFMENFLNSYE